MPEMSDRAIERYFYANTAPILDWFRAGHPHADIDTVRLSGDTLVIEAHETVTDRLMYVEVRVRLLPPEDP